MILNPISGFRFSTHALKLLIGAVIQPEDSEEIELSGYLS